MRAGVSLRIRVRLLDCGKIALDFSAITHVKKLPTQSIILSQKKRTNTERDSATAPRKKVSCATDSSATAPAKVTSRAWLLATRSAPWSVVERSVRRKGGVLLSPPGGSESCGRGSPLSAFSSFVNFPVGCCVNCRGGVLRRFRQRQR